MLTAHEADTLQRILERGGWAEHAVGQGRPHPDLLRTATVNQLLRRRLIEYGPTPLHVAQEYPKGFPYPLPRGLYVTAAGCLALRDSGRFEP